MPKLTYLFRSILILALFFTSMQLLQAQQTTVVKGKIFDADTKEPLPFVNVVFVGTTDGGSTDFDGNFEIKTTKKVNKIKIRSLEYNAGYDTAIVYGKENNLSLPLKKEGVDIQIEVVVRPTKNPALIIMDSVRANRGVNDMYRRDVQAMTYVNTKIKLHSLSEKFFKNFIIKKFKFFFEDPDTINGVPHYPVLLIETISKLYKKRGAQIREIITKLNMSGINNDQIAQFVGSVFTAHNIYDDNNLIFGKTFMSPTSTLGPAYYKYLIIDTVNVNGFNCIKINFKPNPGSKNEFIFTGDLWVDTIDFAIVKTDIKMNPEANLNFLAAMKIDELYTKDSLGNWVMESQIATVDINPRDFVNFSMNLAPKSENFRISATKSTYYRDIQFDKPVDEEFIKFPEQIHIRDDARESDLKKWDTIRYVELDSSSKAIYKKVDSLKQNKFFKFMYKVGDLVGSGYADLDYFAIGPVYEIWSMNEIEGHRIKLGGRTGDKVSKRWYLEGHVVYGTKDERFKWDVLGFYHINKNKNPWRMLGFRYRDDTEQLGLSTNQWRPDNFIGTFLRRRRLSDISYITEVTGFYDHNWFRGFNQKLSLTWMRVYDTGTLRFGVRDQVSGQVENFLPFFTKAEIKLETTFAYDQGEFSGRVKRRPIRGVWPIFKLNYTLGIKGVLGSDYDYHHVKFQVTDRFRIKPLGYTDIDVSVGKIWGTVPYPLMEIFLGNDTYMYDQFGFNLMNYFEFVADQYVTFRIEHYFDGFFLNKIPGINRLKWREVIGLRGAIGSISDENRRYMALPSQTYDFRDQVTGNYVPYLEMNVGIENIFNVLRIDFVYRFTHRRQSDPNNPGVDLYPNIVNWGIVGGLRFKI